MRMFLGVTLLVSGCIVDHHQEPGDPQPAVQPRTCIADITLDGATGTASPTKLGPLALDTNGASVCLHLDATKNLVAAHFAASTDFQPGTSSPFTAVLQDASFATIRDGWDVTVDTRTFANLEWDAPLHEVTDAVLWVRANTAATTTTLSISLFEPFE